MHGMPSSPTLLTHLASLFPNDCPIPVRLWAILDGIIPARILVDVPTAPTAALVQEVAEGTTYLGGALTSPMLADGIAQLRTQQEVVIGCWFDHPLESMLPAAPDYLGSAIDFTNRSVTVDLQHLAAVPPGYQLRRLDRDVIARLEGFDYYAALFGGVDPAIQHTLGYGVIHAGQVVSTAIAGPFTRGVVELGVGTRASYQRQGLATCAAAHAIHACEALGYQPFWNTAQSNRASLALATRLGFQTARPFRVRAWSRRPTETGGPTWR